MNTKRFNQLLESTLGNVKPLLNEDEPSTTKQGNANNVNNLPDLPQESLNSQKGNFTKGLKYFFNKKYPGLNLAYDGNWLDKKYNETMEKFLKEKNIPVHVCQPNDGYCRQDEAGVITTKDFNMLKQAISSDSGTQSQPSTQPIINTNHDRVYDYKLENGKYYYSKKGQNKWVEATGKGLDSIKSKVRFNTQSSSNLNGALQGMGKTLQNLPKSAPQ